MPRGIPKDGTKLIHGTTTKKGPGRPRQYPVPQTHSTETPEQIASRITERFEVMDIMTEITAEGACRAFFISGPPGLGKTVNVTRILEDRKRKMGFEYESVRGMIRATGIYKVLYKNRAPGKVTVFDDADKVFDDETSLNLLKTATDTTADRYLSWRTEAKLEAEDGEELPHTYKFEGNVIFITNIDFDERIARKHKFARHFEALISRAHYLDLTLKTKEDYLFRIRQVVAEGMLLEHGLNEKQEALAVAFFEANVDKLREMSLRMLVKIGNLIVTKPDSWELIARATCLRY